MRSFSRTPLLLPVVVICLLATALSLHDERFFLAAIAIGIAEIAVVAYHEIRAGSVALDYIAFLAMALAAGTGEYLAGAVIALMYTGGEALEAYASRRAEASLSSLLSRLPKAALVKERDGSTHEVLLANVTPNATIVVRGGELVPLDGRLVSPTAILSLANLTGEPLPETVTQGAVIKSGSVNTSEAFDLSVSGSLATSTYAKIIDLVKNAKRAQAPFVCLAARANLPFTLLTLGIASGTYLFSGDLTRMLAVLVIATPCPLIIAAPVAFIGGLSRAASRTTIIKTPAVLETLDRVTTIFFDKTGTLTLGEPRLTHITCLDSSVSEMQALAHAAALEYHSIHPLARAITTAARENNLSPAPAEGVSERIGTGMSGTIAGTPYTLTQAPARAQEKGGISLLLSATTHSIATLHFSDVLKNYATTLITELSAKGYEVAIVTGDRKENAETLFHGIPVTLYADCSPEEKYRIIDHARAAGQVVAMVGDGLNDAPALARADVGIVFSGTENSASIEAADVAILGHDVTLISELFSLSKRSVRIARESVYAGIGLSTLGMLAAAAGFVAPVEGALLQEGIDVAVIVNALRAALSPRHVRVYNTRAS